MSNEAGSAMTQFITGRVDKWIGQAVALRDQIKAIEQRHAEELKEPKELLDMLKGRLQKFFTDTGQDNTKTSAGTAFLSTTYRASLADPQAFMAFVISNQKFELLDRKANVTAVRAFVKNDPEHHLPAGVNLTGTTKVNIRRPGQKDDEEE